MSDTLTDDDKLADLGNRLYQRARVLRADEPITDPRGQPIGWLVDSRMPMLEGELFGEVGEVLAERLHDREITQVVGMGFGAFALVCSVLSAAPEFRGGFIRDKRKAYGRRRLVEGPVDRSKPVVLLDDTLNSGKSATKAIQMLRADGFNVVGMMTVFNFSWSSGKVALKSQNVWVDALLDLYQRSSNKKNEYSGSDSA